MLLQPLTLVAVVVALGMGVMSLRQTRNIQRRQYQLGQLDELITWAMDIARCEDEAAIPPIIPWFKNPDPDGIALMRIERKKGMHTLMLAYQAINTKSRYVGTVSSEFDVDLQTATAKVGEVLANHIDLIRGFLEKGSAKEREEKIVEHRRSLVTDALALADR